MKDENRKRGRRPGSSKFAKENEVARKRMYQLVVVEHKLETAAARLVAKEVCSPGISAEDLTRAEERIRKDFKRWRPELEKEFAARAKAEKPRDLQRIFLPTPQQLKFAREQAEFLASPQGKMLLRQMEEMRRWVEKFKFAREEHRAICKLMGIPLGGFALTTEGVG